MTSNRQTFATPESVAAIERIVAYVIANGPVDIPTMIEGMSTKHGTLYARLCHAADVLNLVHRLPRRKRLGKFSNMPTLLAAGPAPIAPATKEQSDAAEMEIDRSPRVVIINAAYPLHHVRDELVSALFGEPQL